MKQFWKTNLSESWESVRGNPMRNILTGFGVAWGVFILIILLGAGQGLQEGVMRLFGNYAQNSLWITAGTSSEIKQGQTQGRKIQFSQDLISNLPKIFPEIEAISTELNAGNKIISGLQKNGVYQVLGIAPDYFKIKIAQAKLGRLLNEYDVLKARNVVVLGDKLAEDLWDKTNVIGQQIEIANRWFTIVGIIESGLFSGQGMGSKVFLPISTCRQTIFKPPYINSFGLKISKHANPSEIENRLLNYIAHHHAFAANDKKALYIYNQKDMVKSVRGLFVGINMFLWLLGIALLLSGMVGIGNIMLVVVKERTKEIGIRMALGARKKDIIVMVLSESLVITLLSGSIGLLLGSFFISIANLLFFSKPEEDALVQQMSFSVGIGLVAIASLIIAGLFAGLFPARRAANIQPVEALNYDAN